MTYCQFAVASLGSAALSYASPIMLLASMVVVPAAFSLLVLSCVLRQEEEEEDEGLNGDQSNRYTMMSTREWFAQRYVPRALEPAIMKSIPLMKFTNTSPSEPSSSTRSMVGSSCVVCLSPFEENEELKVLPPCQHAFHPLCIDPWFVMHSTCPTCRSEVASSNPAKKQGNEEASDSLHKRMRVPLIEIVIN